MLNHVIFGLKGQDFHPIHIAFEKDFFAYE